MSDVETTIRLVRRDDAAALTEIVTESAEHLRPWEPRRDPAFYTEERQNQLIETALTAAEKGTSAPYVIVSAADRIVGRITLSGITRGALQSAALSYWVRSSHVRRGHGSRAVDQMISHAFGTLKLHRLQAETLPENVPSQRLLRSAGFSLFGIAPSYLRINGTWRDHFMFQLLNERVA